MVEFHGDSTRIALTGFSVGGNGAWSLARRVPKRFARLMVICGFVGDRQGTSSPVFYPSLAPGNPDPYRVVATHLSGIPIWIFHGGADPTVSVEESRRMHAAFRAIGAPVTYTELDGVLHNAWDVAYERPAVAEWLTGGRVSQK
jgi:predicted peptidase